MIIQTLESYRHIKIPLKAILAWENVMVKTLNKNRLKKTQPNKIVHMIWSPLTKEKKKCKENRPKSSQELPL